MLVVCLTFIINRYTDRLNKKNALLIGLILYGIGYVTVTSANTWYVLIAFNLIATMGELIYSPIRNAEQANMIPRDKRGSYSAFSNLSFSGADLVARSTIIIGAFLMPTMMSVYIGFIVMLGTVLVYTGLFGGSWVKAKVLEGCQVKGSKRDGPPKLEIVQSKARGGRSVPRSKKGKGEEEFMIYRRKMYRVSPRIIDDFNLHFNKTLLPTQLKYGSKLVGRWMTQACR